MSVRHPVTLNNEDFPNHPGICWTTTACITNVISECEERTFHDEEDEQTLAIKVVFCSNNGDLLAEAAKQGLGVALPPGFIVEKALQQGRLVAILEQYQRSPMTLFALYTSRHHLPAKTRIFLDTT